MRDSRLLAIVDFPESLLVAPDVLGCSVHVSINGEIGRLNVPRPPASMASNGRRPERIMLSTPRGGRREWVWGDKSKHWGQVVDTKSGHATVDAVIVDFGAFGEDGDSRAQRIHEGFAGWQKRFFEFVKLLSRQGTSNSFEGGDSGGLVEMLHDSRGRTAHVPVRSGTKLTVFMPNMDNAICVRAFRRAARLAAAGRPLRLEYDLLLESYYARRAADYRNTVLQAGAAVEVALVSAIRRACNNRGLAFGDKLISKYNALRGKFELAKLLDVCVPDIDYVSMLLEPRNRVAHQGHLPSRKEANRAVTCAESILAAIAPGLVEATDDV